MFLFGSFRKKCAAKFVKKIIISANEEASFNKSFWISDAEVLMKANYNCNESEERTMTLSEFEKYISSTKDDNISFKVTKTFAYRNPVMFMPEIWHDIEIKDLNARLKKLTKR